MFNVQSTPTLKVGQEFTIALVQRGLKGSNPWVEATFAHRDTGGKVKSETHGADGKVYMSVSMVGLSGLYVFRIDGDAMQLGGSNIHRVRATLFLVL
jgi:hypothetical protein